MESELDELQKAAAALGLSSYARHIFLCADQSEAKCAPRETTLRSWDFLKARLKELNLVGPRPLLMEYLDRYTSAQARRHDVVPGIEPRRGQNVASPRNSAVPLSRSSRSRQDE